MAFSLFKKSKTSDESSDQDSTKAAGFKRDPRKAKRFFEHAQATADSRQYDYSIECYINGLRHEPDNMEKHEALYDVATRRKVAGGKPAGMLESLKSGGSSAVDKMLHAEMVWAKNPIKLDLMLDVMKRAVAADQAEPELNLGEVAFWVGEKILEMNHNAKHPKTAVYLQARDLFRQIGAFDKAVEACRLAVNLEEENAQLLEELRDLQAEATMAAGKYGQGREGDFRQNVADAEKQQDLEAQDSLTKTESVKKRLIETRKAEYEEDPQDEARLRKYVDALLDVESEETEQEAMRLLNEAWERNGQYRYKMQWGDVQMRRLHRRLRAMRQEMQDNPDNPELKSKYEQAVAKVLQFELKEYQERVKNYPTDMRLRFELGKRLYQFRKYDEAIAAFQEARTDPKRRAESLAYLGRCYVQKGWLDEAVDTFREGIDNYELTDDNVALDLRYNLMDAMEQLARKNNDASMAREAQKVASNILQAKINYRDIRDRLNNIRELVDQMQKAASS